MRRLTLAIAAAAVPAAVACAAGSFSASPRLPRDCRQSVSSIPVTWHLAANLSDRSYLDAWCAAVGPVVVEPVSATAEADAREITVVTWNTHVGAGDIAAVVRRLQDGSITGSPVVTFVLLLQEAVRRSGAVPQSIPADARFAGRIVESSGAARDVIAAARELRLNVAYVPSMRNGREQEDRGNAVLSTLPIASVDAIELPFGHQRRVAIAATIVRPRSGAMLRVVTAHFDTALRFGAGGPAAWRRHQAAALASAIAAPDVPTIVGGDFNTWWGGSEPAIRDLRHAFPDASDRVRGPTWTGPFGASARLDYILAKGLKGGAEVRRIADRFGSDHHPLYVVLGAADRPVGATTP